MPTVEEQFYNRTETDSESADVPYIVFDAVDEAAVFTAIDAAVPSTVRNLYLDTVEITERLDTDKWRAVVKYSSREWTESPDSKFSFDTSGGSQHITTSKSTVNRYGPLKADLGELIGYDAESRSVQGTDIVVPVYNFAETHFFSNAAVTSAYKQTIFGLTGKVNNASFKGFSAGEVLFLGASGSRQGDDSNDKWEISFRFGASQNATGLVVGSITGIDKWGWEYMWIDYRDETVTNDAGKEMWVKVPKAVYIEQVYDTGNFADLDIGT